jgi:hypothetical protein
MLLFEDSPALDLSSVDRYFIRHWCIINARIVRHNCVRDLFITLRFTCCARRGSHKATVCSNAAFIESGVPYRSHDLQRSEINLLLSSVTCSTAPMHSGITAGRKARCGKAGFGRKRTRFGKAGFFAAYAELQSGTNAVELVLSCRVKRHRSYAA